MLSIRTDIAKNSTDTDTSIGISASLLATPVKFLMEAGEDMVNGPSFAI